MNSTGMMPGGLSCDSYADRRLRPLDAEHYSAAGLLMYRRVVGEGIKLLLAHERPWNAILQAYDPVALNVLGGKKVPRQERSAETTAVRCFLESVGEVDTAPDTQSLYEMLHRSYAVWYPIGKFALLVVEVPGENVADLPDKFMAVREQQGPPEEFKLLPSGVKKYTKQIERLEWLPASKLLPVPQSDVTNLLSNILQISSFREFLEGTLDPATAWPEASQAPESQWREQGGCPAETSMPKGGKPKGKGKIGGDKGKGGKIKGKGGWKGGKGCGSTFVGEDGKGMGSYATGCGKGNVFGGKDANKGMGMYPSIGMQAGPAMYAPFGPNPAEMQRQMYGEQLFMLVQPKVPSPYLAQKITGMLLELPRNELLMNLTNQEELSRRVAEALEVLKEDGVV